MQHTATHISGKKSPAITNHEQNNSSLTAKFQPLRRLYPTMNQAEQKLATPMATRSLGWFSLALGTAELVAPRTLRKALGVRTGTSLIRIFGVREILAGVGILSGKKTPQWMQARLGGDALDLAALSMTLAKSRRRLNVGVAIGLVGAVAMMDWLSERGLHQKT